MFLLFTAVTATTLSPASSQSLCGPLELVGGVLDLIPTTGGNRSDNDGANQQGNNNNDGFNLVDSNLRPPQEFGLDHNQALEEVNTMVLQNAPQDIDGYVKIVKGQAMQVCGEDRACLDQMDEFAESAIAYALEETDRYHDYAFADENGGRRKRQRRRSLREALPEQGNDLSDTAHGLLEDVLDLVIAYEDEHDVVAALERLEEKVLSTYDRLERRLVATNNVTRDNKMSIWLDRQVIDGAISVAKESTRYWHAAARSDTHGVRDLGLANCVLGGRKYMDEESEEEDDDDEDDEDDEDDDRKRDDDDDDRRRDDDDDDYKRRRRNDDDYYRRRLGEQRRFQDSKIEPDRFAVERQALAGKWHHHKHHYHHVPHNHYHPPSHNHYYPPSYNHSPSKKKGHKSKKHWDYYYHYRSPSRDSWDYYWDDDDDRGRQDDRHRPDDDESRDSNENDECEDSSPTGDRRRTMFFDGLLGHSKDECDDRGFLEKVAAFVLRTGFNAGYTVRADVMGLIFGGVVGKGCASSIVSSSLLFSGIYAACFKRQKPTKNNNY